MITDCPSAPLSTCERIGESWTLHRARVFCEDGSRDDPGEGTRQEGDGEEEEEEESECSAWLGKGVEDSGDSLWVG